MKTKTRIKYHSWTKEEIKTVVRLWDDISQRDLADELGVTEIQLMYVVRSIRNFGYKLTKKRRTGTLRSLIGEAVEELSLKKK